MACPWHDIWGIGLGTIKADLDVVQDKLHDAGTLWPRAELLRWYQDGLRQLLAQSQAVRRLYITDIPPRYTWTHSYEWEARHLQGGTGRMLLLPTLDGTKRVTGLWESEHHGGVSPTDSEALKTQEWERSYGNDTVQHYIVALPRRHDQIFRVAWDDERVQPVTIRELDASDDEWMTRVGEIDWWLPGTGRIQQIEVYEIQTTYVQNYMLDQAELFGTTRQWSGSRTYGVSGAQLENGYAYTSASTPEAMGWEAKTFQAQSAYTDTGDIDGYHAAAADLNSAFLPTYQWTLTSNRHDRKCTYAWEAGDGTETATQRGQWPWAAQHGSTVPAETESPVGVGILQGVGWRFTQAAVNSRHGTQVWEKELEEGETSFSDGSTVGTYWWEAWHGADAVTFAMGLVREVQSPDRQYWPFGLGHGTDHLLGTIRAVHSTADSLSVWHSIVPVVALTEQDEPDVIHARMQKYLRYYTLHRAFGRSGPGQRLDLSAHYLSRFNRGVTRLRKFGDVTYEDMVFARDDTPTSRQIPPRVRLPSTYPAVW